MKETISIVVTEDAKERMIKTVREEIDQALAKLEPSFKNERDAIKLYSYTHKADQIKLTYEIWRDAHSGGEVRHKEDQSE